MRQAKFILALVVLVGLGVALYWYTTKSNTPPPPPPLTELDEAPDKMLEAPADSAAMVTDTMRVR